MRSAEDENIKILKKNRVDVLNIKFLDDFFNDNFLFDITIAFLILHNTQFLNLLKHKKDVIYIKYFKPSLPFQSKLQIVHFCYSFIVSKNNILYIYIYILSEPK